MKEQVSMQAGVVLNIYVTIKQRRTGMRIAEPLGTAIHLKPERLDPWCMKDVTVLQRGLFVQCISTLPTIVGIKKRRGRRLYLMD
jgi:hypothetical protein